MRGPIGLLILILALIFSSPGGSSSPAGTAVGVVPDARGRLDGLTAALAAGDGVFMGQQVVTGNKGQVQIVFSDDTHLVVGPQASLVISEYLMRNTGTARKVVVDALAGTFRFMTGNSPKSAYQINTPTGTLGVRGTAFDFTVDPATGETTVLLYHGGVRMCDREGCRELTDACSVGVIARSAGPSVLGPHDRRRPPVLGDFPYLASQRPLKTAFRVEQAAECKLPQAIEGVTGRVVAAAAQAPAREVPAPDAPRPSSSEPAASASSEAPSSEPPSQQRPPRPRPHDPPPASSSSSEPASSSSSAQPPASSSEQPPASEPPPGSSEPPPASGSEHNNNGFGNGGEGNEGPTETNNPGQGHGNGQPGNGNGNGGVGNGNGNGNLKH